MKSVLLLIVALLAFFDMSCSQTRTYLTDQEKAWNTFHEGEIVVFSTADGRTDSVSVTEVQDKRFPDGLGAETNERLRVLARVNNRVISKNPVEMRILYIFAKTAKDPSKIDFELSVAGGSFWGKAFPIHELAEYAENVLETPYRTFNDVIRIDDNSGRNLKDNDITTIYWSKSFGYVKCQKKDGTIWELIKINSGP